MRSKKSNLYDSCFRLLAILVLSNFMPSAAGQESDSTVGKEIFFLSRHGVLQTGIGRMYCGNDINAEWYESFDYRSPTVIFNEQGEIIETITKPSLAWQISPTMILIDSAEKGATKKDRRLVTLDESYSYDSDMFPVDIGNGILACQINLKTVAYMTTSFEEIDNIGERYGFNLGDNELVGFVSGTTIPIVQHLDDSGRYMYRRVLLPDNTLSSETYTVRDYSGSLTQHHGLIIVSGVGDSSLRRTWIMDPTTGELIQEIKKGGNVVAGSETLIFRRPNEEYFTAYTPEFEWIADLPMKVWPQGVTSEEVLICYDRRQRRNASVLYNRAFRVHDDISTSEARIEMVDHSSYFAIESTHWDHWVRAWANDHSMVLLDGSLKMISKIPKDHSLYRISESGIMLGGSSSTNGEFTLLSTEGKVLLVLNVRELVQD